ncbi:MAG: hypothetical protein OXJ37_10405 [Bryobacterales bacterium]|nr:hypothetical protein [Bryobacterales bacterium]MDE0622433.1 hypothetical protein [Bryobacterales bacterium]
MRVSVITKIVLSVTLGGFTASSAELPAEFKRVARTVAGAHHVEIAAPVLTGTEGLDVDGVRQLFGVSGELAIPGFETAQGVLDGIAGTSTGASRLTSLEIGLAALEYNWFVATLVGDQPRSSELAAEVRSLIAVYDTMADDVVTPTILPPFASAFYPRIEAGQLVMSLRRMAGSAIFRMHIPQVVDPEGYLRQRMNATYARLANTADLIMDAAEAYSLY